MSTNGDESTNALKNEIRSILKIRNISLVALAKMSGMHINTIRRYLGGLDTGSSVGLGSVQAICDGLDLVLTAVPKTNNEMVPSYYKTMYMELVQSLEAIEAITIKQLGVKDGS